MSKSEELKVETSPWSFLPNDVALNCMARLSRLDHAALSLVSKSYRSLMTSPDLYKTRTLMGCTEPCVYVCLRPPPPDTNPRWYILRRGKTSDLVPIPSLPSQAVEASSVVVLDWGIYVIGGLIMSEERTSNVWLLDCRTHTWSQVTCMGVARANAAAGVVDGRIYVFGGCNYCSLSYGEVFDPKTQTWDSLPLPDPFCMYNYFPNSVVCDQKVYGIGGFYEHPSYYSPSQSNWGRGNRTLTFRQRDWCMIDNFLCCINGNGTILWCEQLLGRSEQEVLVTKEVKGLEFLKGRLSRSRLVHIHQHYMGLGNRYKINNRRTDDLTDLLPGFKLSNYGGNIVLYWDIIEGDRFEIWCAEISLERRCQGGEIWGNVEWMNIVLTVDPYLDRFKVLYSASVLV